MKSLSTWTTLRKCCSVRTRLCSRDWWIHIWVVNTSLTSSTHRWVVNTSVPLVQWLASSCCSWRPSGFGNPVTICYCATENNYLMLNEASRRCQTFHMPTNESENDFNIMTKLVALLVEHVCWCNHYYGAVPWLWGRGIILSERQYWINSWFNAEWPKSWSFDGICNVYHWNDVHNMHWRIQEFTLGGAKPRSPNESWGRSPNRGREAPENWGRSPNRGRSPRKNGGRGLGRGLGEPLPENFWKIKLVTINFGAYLKQLFEITNKIKWFNCPHSWNIISNYLIWWNY